MKNKIAVFISCVLLTSVVYAADIYRWVDGNGRVYFSDTVPERYKGVATKVDTSDSELTASQRQDAAERAAREKAIVERAEDERSAPARPSGAIMGEPSSVSKRQFDCERMQREYRESQECFAPYVIRGRNGKRRPGAVREEAFLYCKSVPDPSVQCGSQPQYIGQ
ncbi:DUF4124 domain-containing protein [Herminiimonas arsenitoxidans]|uniref:DUF4124 domain-containing protein n=1 Tax=Herminiimonas arsenitoxidans TaxID=1809410 RepID=UPI0009709046|nr:DUF4124 domain-containing protein [Herminiimonas arsenitoxidans]